MLYALTLDLTASKSATDVTVAVRWGVLGVEQLHGVCAVFMNLHDLRGPWNDPDRYAMQGTRVLFVEKGHEVVDIKALALGHRVRREMTSRGKISLSLHKPS